MQDNSPAPGWDWSRGEQHQLAAAVADPPTNGTPAAERPNPLRRTDWLDVGEDYPGHQVKLWLNPNGATKRAIADTKPTPEAIARTREMAEGKTDADGKPIDPVAQATELAQVRALLKACTLAHRIVDSRTGRELGPWRHPDRDEPLASPSTDEFWEVIPDDILAVIGARLRGEQKKAERRALAIFEPFSDGSKSAPEATAPSGTSAASSPAAGTADPTP